MRLKAFNDIKNTIKLIKTNNWELVTEYFVNRKRMEEKSIIRKMVATRELQECINFI